MRRAQPEGRVGFELSDASACSGEDALHDHGASAWIVCDRISAGAET